jgi:hypothetical protein
MVILSYGNSTWQDFMDAYNKNVIVYCRASSNSNPATGSQTRMAFMAYVSNAESPTNVEFQYYRSMSSHSATAMGDEVYVYKLTNANGGTWSVITRKASIKEIAVASGSKLGVSWSSDKVTLSNTMTASDMPMSSSDATKVSEVISKLTNYLNAVTQNLSYSYATIEIISGEGTFRNYPTVGYNDNFVSITGVVRINGFSRTGSNPGVKITLPVNVKTIYKYDCVMTTAASTEFATIYASGNTVNVSISESVSNYSSANMTIIFMNVILERS